MKPIRVIVADDHPVVREGIAMMLAPKDDIEVVGEAKDGFEAINLYLELKPDIVIMDLIMPRMDGLESIKRLHEINPDVNILVLTSFSDEEKVLTAIKAGAKGYVLKESDPEELIAAIRKVNQKEMWLYPGMADKVVTRLFNPGKEEPAHEELTQREIEVLKKIAEGLSNQEIAEALNVEEGTVRLHVNHILSKLNLSNRTQAALYALKENITSLK
jgi:NarL family two-component system response regulator LiaR